MYNIFNSIRKEENKLKKIIALLLALTIMCFSFVACDNSKNPDEEPSSTEKTPVESVELSLDNWDTYFEFVEESFFTKDASGKVDALRFRHYYKLKSDYKIDFDKSSIEIVYKHTYCKRPITVDFNKQTFELGDATNEKAYNNEIPVSTLSKITNTDYAVLLLQPNKVSTKTAEIDYFDDFKLVSAKGTLHFINE